MAWQKRNIKKSQNFRGGQITNMVHFIYGPCGSGKTTAIHKYIESDVKNGKKIFLIVPEQETVSVEKAIVSSLPYSAQLSVEVVNFSRLCNLIFRKFGGISYNFANKSTKALLMWNTINELTPMLEEYHTNDVADFSLTQKMLSATQELKAYGISPQKLDIASSRVDAESPLYRKLRDISLIYSAYNAQLCETFFDSSDDIAKALDILNNENVFAGSNVYLDSFAGFTKQEYELIARISELCDELYLTLPLPSPHDHSIHLESLRETDLRLKKKLENTNFDETFLTEIHRTSSDSLKYLQNNIWNFEAEPYQAQSSDIKAFTCDTPYVEAEVVACEILKLVKDGAAFKDIAIILRDAEKYRGILDTAFEKYGIPFFMSEKTDLISKALSKYIFSALKIKENNWRGKDVIAHLKSGFCDIDPYEADIFEDYVSTWNINGNKFLGEKWTMNPDGYSARLTKRGERILSVANSVKEKIVPNLSLYFTRLDAAQNVKDMCQATVEFLKDSRITEKVRANCSELLSTGNKKEANEESKLYSITLDILYNLSNTLGDKQFTFEEFFAAFSLMFAESEVGTIPTSADEVIIGSASMLRTSGIKTAILMGLNEGEFPASIKDNGIFTDSDKDILESLDISLSERSDVKTSEELFFVYRALSSPSENLILTSSLLSSDGSTQRQSIVFERLAKLFPSIVSVKSSEISQLDYVWNVETVKEIYPRVMMYPNSSALKNIIENTSGGKEFLTSLNTPISQRNCTVSEELVKKILGDRLSLTQSRLEKYVLCGFDYYCSYVLGLRESKRAIFQLNDIGTFIHYILEMFMKEISASGTLNLTLTDDKIDAILKKIVNNYLFELLGEDYSISNRTKHLFTRLNKLSFMIAKNLINEFKHSDFFPSQFEMKVGMGDGGINALEFELKDGSVVTLRGIADRIDTYKKDGQVYIRVVDYKTGSKEFSFDDLKDGLNTQLLIYLFSICNLENEEQKKMFGCEEGETLRPAGIQYLSSNAPVVSVDSFCESDEIEALIQNEFTRSGLLINDPDILYAINHELDPKIVSKFKANDEGEFVGKGIVGSEGFNEIYAMLSETIVRVAESMRDGKADAIPLRSGEKAPCRYCKMKSVCRASVCKSKN